jgi:hypothetical protein
MRVAYIPPVAGEIFVAKQCAHCGKILPGDTSRYCSGCGSAVASSRPLKKSLSEDTPAWMKQLETIFINDSSNVPSRELRVRVWEQEETKDLSLPENGRVSSEDEVDVVDDLPTRPLSVANSLEISAQSRAKSNHVGMDIGEEEVADEFPTNPLNAIQPQNPPVCHVSPSLATGIAAGATHHDEIQDISTRPHVVVPHDISPVQEKPIHEQRQPMQSPVGPPYSPVMQGPVTPILFPQPQFPSAQPVRQTPPLSIPVPPLARPERKKRTLLAIVFGLFFILLAGGVLEWVKVVQPFTVPEITKKIGRASCRERVSTLV